MQLRWSCGISNRFIALRLLATGGARWGFVEVVAELEERFPDPADIQAESLNEEAAKRYLLTSLKGGTPARMALNSTVSCLR